MNIYLIKRVGRTDYDQYAGFVVAAESPAKAREIASSGYGRSIFAHPEGATCAQIGTAGPKVVPGVILSDYRAG